MRERIRERRQQISDYFVVVVAFDGKIHLSSAFWCPERCRFLKCLDQHWSCRWACLSCHSFIFGNARCYTSVIDRLSFFCLLLTPRGSSSIIFASERWMFDVIEPSRYEEERFIKLIFSVRQDVISRERERERECLQFRHRISFQRWQSSSISRDYLSLRVCWCTERVSNHHQKERKEKKGTFAWLISSFFYVHLTFCCCAE